MKKTLYAAAVAAIAVFVGVALTSCAKKTVPAEEPKAGMELDLDSRLASLAQPVASDSVYARDFKFGDLSIPTTVIDKIVKSSDEIYLSLSVTAPDSLAGINAYIDKTVVEMYNNIADNKIAPADVATASQLADAITAICDNFATEVAPEYIESIAPVCSLNINMAPVYAKGDLVTYAVYNGYYTGGAHGIDNFCYVTLTTDGKELTADQIIKPEDLGKVRAMIVATIAASRDMTVEEYLKSLNDFLMTDEATPITTEGFPIYNMGLTAEGVVVSYPTYSIGPASDGNPSYLLPLADIAPYLAL